MKRSLLAAGFLMLFVVTTVGFVTQERTCRVSETMPAEDGGPDWSRWVEVPCDSKPPSSARVETRVNPVPVDVDREAVDGGRD